MPLKVGARPATADGTLRLRRGLLRQMVHAILIVGGCRHSSQPKAGSRAIAPGLAIFHATPHNRHQAQGLLSPLASA